MKGLVKSVGSLASDNQIRVLSLFDNEEVGSKTAHGADSNLLEVTLRRLANLKYGGSAEVSEMISLFRPYLYLFVINILRYSKGNIRR